MAKKSSAVRDLFKRSKHAYVRISSVSTDDTIDCTSANTPGPSLFNETIFRETVLLPAEDDSDLRTGLASQARSPPTSNPRFSPAIPPAPSGTDSPLLSTATVTGMSTTSNFVDRLHAQFLERDLRRADGLGHQVGGATDRHQVARLVFPDRVDRDRAALGLADHADQAGLYMSSIISVNLSMRVAVVRPAGPTASSRTGSTGPT